MAAARDAPFYYLHLRRHAQRLLYVPFGEGPLARGSQGVPVFLFSPGRCGSTLLSKVLSAAGSGAVSEPDFYTQSASWFWSRPYNPLRPSVLSAVSAMSADLVDALGGYAVVKLRAECARAPELFVGDARQRTLMLFRGFEDWALSTAKVFGGSPRKIVGKYMTALRCYAWLMRHSRCHLMRYEDWLTGPQGTVAALSAFLGLDLDVEGGIEAGRGHSQAGTPLMNRTLDGWEARWYAALQLWHAPRLVTARQALEIPAVWD